jgi:hypothetical protein
MSEPTSGGNKPPDPDHEQDPGKVEGPDQGQSQGQGQDQVQDKVQDQDPTSGSTFNDPTAPIWSEETAPISTPPPPPPPPGATYPDDQQRAATPPVGAPASNPYAPPPPAPPYGQPTDQYRQPAAPYSQPTDQYGHPAAQYGQPQPGSPYPTYGQQPYAGGPSIEPNVSAIVLTVLSALSLCTVISAVPLVLGIVALTKNATDHEGSRRLTKVGWIAFVVSWALVFLFFIGLVVLGALSGGSDGSPRFNAGY